MSLKLLFAILAVGWTMLSAGPADSFIVFEGEPRAEIVIAEEPPPMVRLAAGELQDVIKKISGAELPIVTDRVNDDVVAIYVGRSPHTDALGIEVEDLDFDAYRMVSGDDWLALLGRDDEIILPEPYDKNRGDMRRALEDFKETTGLHISRLPTSRVAWREYHPQLEISEHDGRGTANAVYAFLSDLGFRWYFPGEIGQVIPEHTTISLPQVDRTVRPDFPLRRFEQYYHRFGQAQATEDEIKWQLSLGLNSGYELRGLGATGHGLSSITTGRYAYTEGPERDAFHAGHPEEFYALYDGKRDIGAAQCLSSEALFETSVDFARAVFDIYDVKILDLSPEDGFGRLCECPLCEGKDTPERGRRGALSDHVWGFINRVAEAVYETHPDRYIGGLAYSSYLLPPAQIEEMSPNVAVMMCKWRTWQGEDSVFTQGEVRQLREDWLEILPSGKFMRWDYFLHARPTSAQGVPVYFPRLIAEDLRWLRGRSDGEASEVFRNYAGWDRDWHALATNHLNLYVTARYLWDADQDIDELLEDYYETFYGPAAGEMRAFVEFCEENWRSIQADPDAIDHALDLLGSARSAVEPGSVYAERMEVLTQFTAPLQLLRDQLTRDRRDDVRYRVLRTGLSNRGRMSEKTFDGRLDDPRFWPPNIRRAQLRNIHTGEAPEVRTYFQIFRERDHLYLGILCHEPEMQNLNLGTTRDNDPAIFDGDHVTLLIETLTHSYYEITINPAGSLYDVDHAPDGAGAEWSSGAQVAVHHGEDYWSAEIRVPIAGAGARILDPKDGIDGDRPTNLYPWYFNVGRQRGDGEERERTAYSATGEPDLHILEAMGGMWGR